MASIPIRRPEEDDDDDDEDDDDEDDDDEDDDRDDDHDDEDAVIEDEITEEELDFYQASDPIGELLTHLTTIHRCVCSPECVHESSCLRV